MLRDLLAAPTIPRVRLTQIFRQAAQSGVVTNAHRINAGRPPLLQGLPDFFLFACDDTDATAALTVDVACTRIPARFRLDPRRDVQVLTPMHRGPAGAGALNGLLQQKLTPHREGQPERRMGGRVFRSATKSPRSATTTTRAKPASSTAPSASSPPSPARNRPSPCAPTRTKPSTTTSTNSTNSPTPTP
nr:hypothetical protein [Micromonospora craniellae]